jgi:hypothetical protein
VRSESGALKPLAKFLRRHGPGFTTPSGRKAIRERSQDKIINLTAVTIVAMRLAAIRRS